MQIKFTIDGQPCSKQRPRFARQGRFVKTYNPKQTAEYENWVHFNNEFWDVDKDYKINFAKYIKEVEDDN